ncbi:MAG: hypothetical protein RR821_05580 [Clostridia bacterium]
MPLFDAWYLKAVIPIDALLEMIKDKAGCYYMSDLHEKPLSKQAKMRIAEIPVERFSLEEWIQAVAYILNCSCHCTTVEEARAQLLESK